MAGAHNPLGTLGLGAPVTVTFNDGAAAAAQVDHYCFVSDDYYTVVQARVNHRVNGGASCALDIKKVPSGTALASGVSVLATAFDLTTGAATPQLRSERRGTLTATLANRQLIPGDSLGLDYSGTLTGLLGVGGTIVLKRTRKTKDK